MSAPNPPPPPHGGEGGGSAGKDSLQQASASASETQPIIDVFGSDMAPAVFTLALLMLNMLSGMPSLSRRRACILMVYLVFLTFLAASQIALQNPARGFRRFKRWCVWELSMSLMDLEY